MIDDESETKTEWIGEKEQVGEGVRKKKGQQQRNRAGGGGQQVNSNVIAIRSI